MRITRQFVAGGSRRYDTGVPKTPYFGPGLFTFLRELATHNEREWFARHKTRYFEQVRDPMLAFIGSVGPRLEKISPQITADPRPQGGSFFRIHRDLRFSRDKRPYKTHAGAHFRHGAGRNVHAPGMYLHLEPGEVLAAAGIWHPASRELGLIRDAIVDDPELWRKIRRLPPSLQFGGELLKRAPKGYDPEHPLIDDLKRKDFYCVVHFDETQALEAQFMTRFVRAMRSASPLMHFLCDALDLPW